MPKFGVDYSEFTPLGQGKSYNDLIICILLSKSSRSHCNLISDSELYRTERIFLDLIKKDPKMHENYFGMAKIYFYKNELNESIQMIEKCLQGEGSKEKEYFVWACIIHFIRYQLAKSTDNRKLYA